MYWARRYYRRSYHAWLLKKYFCDFHGYSARSSANLLDSYCRIWDNLVLSSSTKKIVSCCSPSDWCLRTRRSRGDVGFDASFARVSHQVFFLQRGEPLQLELGGCTQALHYGLPACHFHRNFIVHLICVRKGGTYPFLSNRF